MHKKLVAPTISIWNLDICRTRGPSVDIRCSNKELILERGTGSRKFLDVAESESGHISFPRSGGHDSLITLPSLGREGDGRTLIESVNAQSHVSIIDITYSEAGKGLKQCPFLRVCTRICSRRGWSRPVGISRNRRPRVDIRRCDEEWTLDKSTRGGELLCITKGYTGRVALALSGNNDTLIAFCGLGKEGDCRPLMSKEHKDPNVIG